MVTIMMEQAVETHEGMPKISDTSLVHALLGLHVMMPMKVASATQKKSDHRIADKPLSVLIAVFSRGHHRMFRGAPADRMRTMVALTMIQRYSTAAQMRIRPDQGMPNGGMKAIDLHHKAVHQTSTWMAQARYGLMAEADLHLVAKVLPAVLRLCQLPYAIATKRLAFILVG